MADKMEFHADDTKVVLWVTSDQLTDEWGRVGHRQWTTDQVVDMATGKQWGHGLDTGTAAMAVRHMEHTQDGGLVIEFDPDGLELVVVRHLASGAATWSPDPGPDATKVVLLMIWSAARRGVEHLFDELPVPWWAGFSFHDAPAPTSTPADTTPRVANYSTHHLRAMVPVFAHVPKGGSLWDVSDKFLRYTERGARALMNADPDHLHKRVEAERVHLARSFLADQVPSWVVSYWKLSPDEGAVNAFLEDQFHRHGPPARWPDAVTFDTMEQVLEGMGWADNSTNRERLTTALVNLHSIHRPHVYAYKGRKRKRKGKEGTEWRQFRSLEPLWRVQYETGTGAAIIVKPGDMAALKHQIDEHTHGVPHFYTTLPLGRFAQLEAVAPSTMVAHEADQLLIAFLRDAGIHAPEPDNANEFVLTYTLSYWAMQWTPPTQAPRARIRERAVKDDQERALRARVLAFADECTEAGRKLSDRELGEHLGTTTKEATRLRERAGIVLRVQHRSVKPPAHPKANKMRARVERALEVLAERWPGFLVELPGGRLMDTNTKEDVFRVRVCPGRVNWRAEQVKGHRATTT